ncbi:MAG: UDP-N-acetylmuramate dehydrogenase [Spirulinaceae cyanobacterium]
MTLSYSPSSVTKTTFSGVNKSTKSPINLAGGDCLIKPQFNLGQITSFRVGGPAQWYVTPRQWEDLLASFEWAKSRDLPITLLGAGSNLLVSDRGIPGLVVGTRYLRHTQFDLETGQITAGAGEPIARIAYQAAKRGWRGLEWAVGIPGTVGGGVVMNAGAHSKCVADSLVDTMVLSPTGNVERLKASDLNFSYRTSSLQGENNLVTQATFQLQPGFSRTEVMEDTNRNLRQRKSSQPYHLPSCGSVFRNPKPHSAGRLIEQLGLKGYQIGGAQIAHRHANFILNCGGATASDIFRLIHYIQEQVEQHWSLCLEPEVKMLGKF